MSNEIAFEPDAAMEAATPALNACNNHSGQHIFRWPMTKKNTGLSARLYVFGGVSFTSVYSKLVAKQ